MEKSESVANLIQFVVDAVQQAHADDAPFYHLQFDRVCPMTSTRRWSKRCRLPRITVRCPAKARREEEARWKIDPRGSVFHRACCCPSCFCQTSPGNPRPPASLRPSARRSHREKCGRTANDRKAHRPHAPVVLSPTTNWIRFA